MLQILSAPETLTAPATAHRFKVQLASIATELDAYGVPVPVTTKMLDVVVTSPSLSAITKFLFSKGHLAGYQIVSHWVPADGCDCF